MKRQFNEHKSYSLSVFFPFYNEEANIREAVETALYVLGSMEEVSAYEVIIVDDGSTDRTKQIAQELAARDSHVRLVAHETNRGYGEALRTGFNAACYEYVFFTDGDLQFDMREITKLTRYIRRYDAVIGFRAPRKDPFMRLVNAAGWNALNRLAFGLRIKDIDCAFKLFKRGLITDMPLISGGAMLSAELLVRLQKQGVRIKQVPVTHLPRKAGSPTGAKLAVIARAFGEWWRLYRTTDLGNRSYLQAARFMIVGLINTVIDVAIYYVLTRYTGFFPRHIVATRFLSFFGGTVSSFALNRAWTFEKRDALSFVEVVRFYATVAMSLVIGLLSMSFLVNTLHLYDLIALALSIVCTFVWNFSITKLWVFKPSAPTSLPPVGTLRTAKGR